MYKLAFFLSLAVAVLTQPSCASSKQNRWLNAHRDNLNRIANSNMSAEQKMDGLAADYVQFMKEDLKFIDPVKGVKYVRIYHDQNEAAMNKIIGEAERYQGQLDLAEKVSLGVRVVQKPYLKDLIDLTPKFKRKYKQYAFAVKLASRIGGGLSQLAGKALGF